MHLDPGNPIGVFDSGVGGLTVVRALMERLPFESIHYFGDTARVPYGVKSVETIAHYTTQIAQFLLEKRVKLLIVACNTMAAVAAGGVRDLSPVPVLDVIDAGAISALAASPRRSIGVIGGPVTISASELSARERQDTQAAQRHRIHVAKNFFRVERDELSRRVERVRATLQQRFDPCPGRREPGLQRIALLRQLLDLFGQQRIGALQFLVAQQQALDAFGELFDLLLLGHAAPL